MCFNVDKYNYYNYLNYNFEEVYYLMANNKNKTEVYNDNGIIKIKTTTIQEQEITTEYIHKQLANLERRKYDMLLEIDKIQENIVNYQNILHDIDNIIKS